MIQPRKGEPVERGKEIKYFTWVGQLPRVLHLHSSTDSS